MDNVSIQSAVIATKPNDENNKASEENFKRKNRQARNSAPASLNKLQPRRVHKYSSASTLYLDKPLEELIKNHHHFAFFSLDSPPPLYFKGGHLEESEVHTFTGNSQVSPSRLTSDDELRTRRIGSSQNIFEWLRNRRDLAASANQMAPPPQQMEMSGHITSFPPDQRRCPYRDPVRGFLWTPAHLGGIVSGGIQALTFLVSVFLLAVLFVHIGGFKLIHSLNETRNSTATLSENNDDDYPTPEIFSADSSEAILSSNITSHTRRDIEPDRNFSQDTSLVLQ